MGKVNPSEVGLNYVLHGGGGGAEKSSYGNQAHIMDERWKQQVRHEYAAENDFQGKWGFLAATDTPATSRKASKESLEDSLDNFHSAVAARRQKLPAKSLGPEARAMLEAQRRKEAQEDLRSDADRMEDQMDTFMENFLKKHKVIEKDLHESSGHEYGKRDNLEKFGKLNIKMR